LTPNRSLVRHEHFREHDVMADPASIFLGASRKPDDSYQRPEQLLLKYGNRHGLVTGATGTGKTVTLQIMAEGFSNAGVPVFCADIKGDGIEARPPCYNRARANWAGRACARGRRLAIGIVPARCGATSKPYCRCRKWRMRMDADRLISESAFPAADRSRWLALVEKALAGAPYDETMVGRSDDGLPLEPLARRRLDPVPLARRRSASPWAIVQRCDDTDPARANRQALDDVANGATGLALVFEGAPNAFGYGLPDHPDTLERVLDGVPLDRIHLRVDAHPSSRVMADHLVAFLTKRRADPSKAGISLGIDPAAIFAGTGRLRMSIEALQASMPQSLAHFFAMGVPGILLEADGRVFHNAGATEAQELGAMLAGAVAHLRLFQEARQALIYAAPYIGFALSVDQDQFLSVAKIRALRLLWQRTQEVVPIKPARGMIHAETSYRMVSALDPETNILRATLAAFAAGVGGADSISVLPHTIAHGLPEAFARRVARNTQLVLAAESHIDFVADPVAGSGGIEALTDALCEAGWDEFQRIEKEGGLLRSLAAGALQSRILEARARRAADYKSGKRAIIGTTLFPARAEQPVDILSTSPRPLPTDGIVFCQRLDSARIDETIGATA